MAVVTSETRETSMAVMTLMIKKKFSKFYIDVGITEL